MPELIQPKDSLDQFTTFEVFVQPKEGKPFQHEGIVHAPDLEMAYVLAKETFTRRFSCMSIFVVATNHVFLTPITSGSQNVYDLIEDTPEKNSDGSDFLIFHLLKRGKQHIEAGVVQADSPETAIGIAKQQLKGDKMIYSVWAIAKKDIRFTTAEEKDLWMTLPEKKFRDAADYKGGDKLKAFLEKK